MKDSSISRIAFGSCAKQWMPQPIWNSIENEKSDLFIFLGDAIYGDWNDTAIFEISAATLDRDYKKLAAIPEFKKFRESTPIMATWDNHDYGSHDGGVTFKHKELSKQKFLDFFGEYQESERRNSPGIYDAKIHGPEGKRVQIILLDTRWYKSPFKLDTLSKDERAAIGKVGKYIANTDSGATQLGAEQWAWLEEQMKTPAEIRLICSSTQVIPNEKGMDEWSDFPKDRERLLNLISESEGKSVILSGNVHFAEVSQINWEGIEVNEFTSSGMTHINEAYGLAPNQFRLGEPYIDLNFGVIEIDWSSHQINFNIMDAQGTLVSEQKQPF